MQFPSIHQHRYVGDYIQFTCCKHNVITGVSLNESRNKAYPELLLEPVQEARTHLYCCREYLSCSTCATDSFHVSNKCDNSNVLHSFARSCNSHTNDMYAFIAAKIMHIVTTYPIADAIAPVRLQMVLPQHICTLPYISTLQVFYLQPSFVFVYIILLLCMFRGRSHAPSHKMSFLATNQAFDFVSVISSLIHAFL